MTVYDAIDLIQNRRSEEGPLDPQRPVSKEDVKRILEAARWASTPHNMQNYEIVVVDDKKVIEELGAIKFPVTLLRPFSGRVTTFSPCPRRSCGGREQAY